MATLETIVEMLDEGSSFFESKGLDELIDAAEGDGLVEVEVDLDEDPEIPDESELDPFAEGKPQKVPVMKVGKVEIALPENVQGALRRVNQSMKTVDVMVEKYGKEVDEAMIKHGKKVYQSQNWWKEVRKQLNQRKFSLVKYNIDEFCQALDKNYEEQKVIRESLEQLRDELSSERPTQ